MSKVEVDAAFKEYDKNKVRWKEIKLLRRDLFGTVEWGRLCGCLINLQCSCPLLK